MRLVKAHLLGVRSNPASEPLLHSSHEGSGDPVIIWEGTTWQTCPFLLKCLTPAICSAWQWRVTTQRIDLTHGCCSSDEVRAPLLFVANGYPSITPEMLAVVLKSLDQIFLEMKVASLGGAWLSHSMRCVQDTFDLRRIDDLHFQRSLLQRLFNRGTVRSSPAEQCFPPCEMESSSQPERIRAAWPPVAASPLNRCSA